MPLILLKFLKKNSEISNRFGVIRSFDPQNLVPSQVFKKIERRIIIGRINFYKLLVPKKVKNDRNE